LLRFDRGFPLPSPAVLGRIGAGYVRIERFAAKSVGAVWRVGLSNGHEWPKRQAHRRGNLVRGAR